MEELVITKKKNFPDELLQFIEETLAEGLIDDANIQEISEDIIRKLRK